MLASLLIFLLVPQAQAVFIDVPTDHPAFESVDELQFRGIVQGDTDGKFRPDDWINRVEFTKIIVEALVTDAEIEGCVANGKGKTFSDMEDDDWGAKYICTASARGYVRGYPDGTFRHGNNINVAEAAMILSNAYHADSSVSDPWYISPLRSLESRRALPPSLRHYGEFLTRGEMALMINAMEEMDYERPSLTLSELLSKSSVNAPSSYEYDYLNPPGMAIGTKVGEMTLAKVKTPFLTFTGDITVTGRYQDDREEEGLFYNSVCVTDLDEESRGKVPGYKGFCLDTKTNSALLAAFPRGSKGHVTLRVKSITRNHCECEGWDTAIVTEVLEVRPDPRTEGACTQTGGQWEANAIYRYHSAYDGSTEIRGVCYPPNNAYVGRMRAFDGCGAFPSYSAKPW